MEKNTLRFRAGQIKLWASQIPLYITAWAFCFAAITLTAHLTGVAINLVADSDVIPALQLKQACSELAVNTLTLVGAILAALLIVIFNVRLQRVLLIPAWLLNLPVFLISCVIPKKPDRWLFAARQGNAFAENPKYLFRYISSEVPDIEAIWITKSRSVYRVLQEEGLRVSMCYSPKGYWYSMTAGVLFMSHYRLWEPDANNFAIGRGTLIMQLWHGSPMKRLGNTVESDGTSTFSIIIGRLLVSVFPFLKYRSSCHRMLAACPIVAEHLGESFDLDQEHMLVAGYPKNDDWLKRAEQSEQRAVRKVIYMPTFRPADWKLFVEYEFDLERLDAHCRQNGLEFHIKLHQYSLPRVRPLMDGLEGATNVFYCECEDIYEILDQFDVLVTDYSSIAFDYLLCDRPIIYAPFDYESYRDEDRGFLEDFEKLTPGPKAGNWRELEALMIDSSDTFHDARQALNERYNSYRGSNSSELLVNETRKLIAQKVGYEPPVNHREYV
ncbi:MAG: CDP-glycerol glycerophosphotransferase family protein [Halioglobus sp.]